MTKFSTLLLFLTFGLLTGPAIAVNLTASIDHAKPSKKPVVIPIQPKTLIEKVNVSPSDANITIEVLEILKQAEALDVAVVSKNGKVTLIGFVPNSEDRNKIIDLVKDVEGVQKVDTKALAATSLNSGFGR